MVAYAVSSNGDLHSVRIFFVVPIFAHIIGVRDLVTVVMGDIFLSDYPESISSLDTLFFGDFRSLTYTLAQAFQFI